MLIIKYDSDTYIQASREIYKSYSYSHVIYKHYTIKIYIENI